MEQNSVKHIVLGTAGHIDHGKTTLIKALTGIDCDRLKEEKRRGITIELGFTSMILQQHLNIGIIDVPGHEKFIHHMVAGVGGIDFVLLVIAADEGAMPQTKEHLDICQLLGIQKGIIALTKIDIVSDEWLELVTDDIRTVTEKSFLAKAPIIPVSSHTKQGLDELTQAITQLAEQIIPKRDDGNFRLPIDRVFTMKGFGTVVTGTVLNGRAKVGQVLEILPQRIPAKIRGLQVFNQKTDHIVSGQRAAINLQGIEKNKIERGNVLFVSDTLRPSYIINTRLSLTDNAPPLSSRTRIRFHSGTNEILGRIIVLDRKKLKAGDTAYVQLRLEKKVAVLPFDNYIIRTYSPIILIGGGYILENLAKKSKGTKVESLMQALSILDKGTDKDRIEYYIKQSQEKCIDLKNLIIRNNLTKLEIIDTLNRLQEEKRIIFIDNDIYKVIHSDIYEKLNKGLCAILTTYHQQFPLSAGIPRNELKEKLSPGLDSKLYARIVDDLTKSEKISIEKEHIKIKGYTISLSANEESLYQSILKIYQDSSINPPKLEEICDRINISQTKAETIIQLLIDRGEVIRVNEDFLFHRTAISKIKKELLSFFQQTKDITIGRFKDLFGISRKYAIPLLEFMDTEGITLRVGDKRVLKNISKWE
ncbi:MAG: selenocysteine-specific translation elongation factor [bacterium]